MMIDLAIISIDSTISHDPQLHILYLDKSLILDATLLNSLSTMEDIIMIGYPNGIWDQTHNLPIIRKGITATHPKLDYNGKPEFIIDAACFPGSSGSPVFLANLGTYLSDEGNLNLGTRIALLGTLYSGHIYTVPGEIKRIQIPTNTKEISETGIMINLGSVIHASKLNDFEPILQDLYKNNNRG